MSECSMLDCVHCSTWEMAVTDGEDADAPIALVPTPHPYPRVRAFLDGLTVDERDWLTLELLCAGGEEPAFPLGVEAVGE